jgi:hypothetical protein
MMIGRMLSHVAGELGHLNFFAEYSLETSKEDFSLARLKAINHRGNRSEIICIREMYQLFVNEFEKP